MDIKSVKDIFKQKHDIFKNYEHEMIAAYRRELAVAKDYNGRQILELIQNCDDAGASKVVLELNSEEKTIAISNNGGKAFSLEGYRSLSIDSLSAKTDKKAFIGNKGLGFRAILNWAEVIKLYSNNICLEFSKNTAKSVFDSLYTSSQLHQMRSEMNFNANVIPTPILCCPSITSLSSPYNHTTTVEVKYIDAFYEDIKEQLRDIASEILIFLKNLTSICIICDGDEKNYACNRNSNLVEIESVKWDIYTHEGELPTEINDGDTIGSEFYQIKLAIPREDVWISQYIYSFFPTKVAVNHNYLLHATFDLDISRNHLNYSSVNKWIVEKIAELLVTKVIENHKSSPADWRIFDILNTNEEKQNKDLKNLGYYNAISGLLRSKDIIPCVDGSYKSIDTVDYINDSISDLAKNKNTVFPTMILPKGTTRNIDSTRDQFSEDDLIKLNKCLKLISDRGDWIYEINKLNRSEDYNVGLLIDEDENIIACENVVFTPASNKDIAVPKHCDITTMNSELYKYFADTKLQIKASDKSRVFVEKLKIGYEMRSYEPMHLTRAIIRATNDIDSQTKCNCKQIIQNTIFALYNNYKLAANHPSLDVKLMLPNKNYEFVSADQLVFSSSYTFGKITVDIFQNVYDKKHYLIDRHELVTLASNNENSWDWDHFEQFLKWLGISEFAQIKRTKYSRIGSLFQTMIYDSDVQNNHFRSIEISEFRVQDILSKINISELLIWIKTDKWMNNIINSYLSYSDKDQIIHEYYGQKTKYVSESYIKRCVKKRFNTESIIIDNRYQWFNDSFSIDNILKDPLVVKYDIDKDFVTTTMKLLGAKQSISSLSKDIIIDIINKLPKQFPDGKNSQTIYKEILDYLRNNNINLPSGIKLFAYDGSELCIRDNSNLYFSEKMQIPKVMQKDYPIFNFPARAGGSEAVKRFGLNKLEDLRIDVSFLKEDDQKTKIIKSRFQDYMALILSIRLENLNVDSELKSAADTLKSIEFKVCEELDIKVSNDKCYTINTNEYIKANGIFYIKSSRLSSQKMLYSTLADIISISYDINTIKDPVFITLDSNSIDDAFQYVEQNYGKEKIDLAKELLGISSPQDEIMFNIGRHTNIDETIKLTLINILTDVDMININDSTIRAIKSVLDEVNLNETDFLQNDAALRVRIFDYNYKKYKKYFESKRDVIISKLKTLCNLNNNRKNLLDKIAQVDNEISILLNGELRSILALGLENNLYNKVLDSLGLSAIEAETSWETDIFKGNEAKMKGALSNFTVIFNNKEKSMMHYALSEEEFSQLQDKIKTRLNQEQIGLPNIDRTKTDSTLISDPIITSKLTSSNDHNRAITAYNAENHNKNKQILGKNSEEIVVVFMKENSSLYKEIYHASIYNSGSPYDIKYTCAKTNKVIYVEVKSFKYGCFELSNKEFEFAKDNCDNYEIWLVADNKLIKLTKQTIFDEDNRFALPYKSSSYKIEIDIKSCKQP